MKTNKLITLSDFVKEMDKEIGMKMSARGWAYALEGTEVPGLGEITKGAFDLIEKAINDCRKLGYLPVDFVETEEARKFSGVETPEDVPPVLYLREFLEATIKSAEYYTPEWWVGEKYYVQMIVEKIDLKTLFSPICRKFHIPIATSKGWSSILQRAEYAKRFKLAEADGLICVLLYCGDHDPDGLRISEFLRKNLVDLENVYWRDKTEGYDPSKLIIDRFGLNYDFIVENNLSWIENLITGSKRDLASPTHKNHHMPYVQEYIKTVGVRKCEANAIVKQMKKGKLLCLSAIRKYYDHDTDKRFKEKRQAIIDEINDFFAKTDLDKTLNKGLKIIDKEYGDLNE